MTAAVVPLQPDGTVVGPAHPLSTIVKDDVASTVDANLNGIIDQAEGCPTCAGGGGAIDARFVGGLPFPTLSSAINGQIYGEKFPIQVSPTASLTVVTLQSGENAGDLLYDGCSGSGAYVYSTYITFTEAVIDWNARSIRAVQYASEPLGGLPPEQRIWQQSNAQNNVVYYSDTCPSAGCPEVMVDFDNRVIHRLPLGGKDAFAGTVETYS